MNENETRNRILNNAKSLFLKNGYSSTSIDQICAKASVSKGGFYHLFSSKEQLALEVLERFYLKHEKLLADGDYRNIEDPFRRTLSYVDHVKLVADRIWGDGCLLILFSTDLTGYGSGLRKRIKELFDDFIHNTALVFMPLFEGVSPDPEKDSYKLAETFIAQLEGYIVMSRAYGDPSIITKGIGNFKEQIKNLKQTIYQGGI